MNRTLSTVLVAFVTAAVTGGVIAAIADGGSGGNTPPPLPAQPATAVVGGALTPAQLYARDTPGVVVITSTSTEKVPATLFAPAQSEKVESLGSGFVIDKKGDILTNEHVIGGPRASASGSPPAPAIRRPWSARTRRPTSRSCG